MKIGILTFHYAHNYGAMLQAYALSTWLNNNGYDAVIIDYRLPFIYDNHRKFTFRQFVKYYRSNNNLLFSFLKAAKNYRTHRNFFRMVKWTRFEDFLNNILRKTDYIESIEQINQLGLDTIICGSDQIWNEKLTGGYIPLYFAEGIKKSINRISYAASTGDNSVESDKVHCFCSLLTNFDHISVREKGLSDFMNLKGVTNQLVLDPIFLLEDVQWKKIERLPIESDYVMTYSFGETPHFFEKAQDISRRLNKKMICFLFSPHKNIPKSAIQYYSGGPQEFLGYFSKASFVITNSFHGTAFSILYKKQFICIPPQRGRERTDSILSLLGLCGRIIEDYQAIGELRPIDYKQVYSTLELLRNQSKSYLEKSLQLGGNK